MSADKKVSLFIPCLVDQVYPEMGVAMVEILEYLGYEPHYNTEQTCCGQPAFNAGHMNEARKVSSHFLDCFREAEVIICPSGSCTSMVRNHYAEVFAGDNRLTEAKVVGARVFEFSEFIHHEDRIEELRGARLRGHVAFHCSCHALRELGMSPEIPRLLLRQVTDTHLVEIEGPHQCCGFGGLFTAKYPEISDSMAEVRFDQLAAEGVDTIVSNDPGCIMTLRRTAREKGDEIRVYHLTEYIAKALRNIGTA